MPIAVLVRLRAETARHTEGNSARNVHLIGLSHPRCGVTRILLNKEYKHISLLQQMFLQLRNKPLVSATGVATVAGAQQGRQASRNLTRHYAAAPPPADARRKSAISGTALSG